MSDRLPENIDDLEMFYKDSLSEFEETPAPKVLDNVLAKLREEETKNQDIKPEKKAIPLWKYFGLGIAASIAIGIFILISTDNEHPADYDIANPGPVKKKNPIPVDTVVNEVSEQSN